MYGYEFPFTLINLLELHVIVKYAFSSQRAKVVTPSLTSPPPHLWEGKGETSSTCGYTYPGVPRFWLRVMMNNRAVCMWLFNTDFGIMTLDLLFVFEG